MDLIHEIDEGRDRCATDNLIRMPKAEFFRDGPATMTGEHVRMRLIENASLRRLPTNAGEQIEIGSQAATTTQDRTVIFDLSGNEDQSSIVVRSVEPSAAAFILAESRLNDQVTHAARTGDLLVP